MEKNENENITEIDGSINLTGQCTINCNATFPNSVTTVTETPYFSCSIQEDSEYTKFCSLVDDYVRCLLMGKGDELSNHEILGIYETAIKLALFKLQIENNSTKENYIKEYQETKSTDLDYIISSNN